MLFLATGFGGLQAQSPAALSIVGPTQVRLGNSANYSALANGSNASVLWSVDGFAGGKVSYGIISPSGMYTPGNEIYAGHSVTIGATTVSTPVSSTSLTVKVLNQLPILSGGSATQKAPGASFLLDVRGSNFVAASQLLLAGTDVATIFVSATELQSSISLPAGTATVSVGVLNPNAEQKSPVSRTLPVQSVTATVVLAPGNVTLTISQNQPFTATVTGTPNTAVKWTLGSALGTISRSGMYTAPASIPSALTVEVTATSVADPSESASASVALAPPAGASYTYRTPEAMKTTA